jgi:predicted phosphodiesterase
MPYKIKPVIANINEVVHSVCEKSLEYAIANNSHVFTGHTHQPMLTKVDNYIIGNDGSWTNETPTFIGIIDNHVILSTYTLSGEQTQKLCLLNEVQES